MQGGYSDDLTVASKFAEHKLQILCPSYAMLPQWCALSNSVHALSPVLMPTWG